MDLMKIGLLVLAGIVLYFLVTNYSRQKTVEGFEHETESQNVQPSSGPELHEVEAAPETAQENADCFPKEQLNAKDLLPGDSNSTWAQVNPSGQGELGDVNFLEAGHHVGVNTVGQSLRNANRQLRSEPANPQVKVSPWLQSTIDPDIRRPLEIGSNA
jgi:hypothetical protein